MVLDKLYLLISNIYFSEHMVYDNHKQNYLYIILE